MKVNEGVSQHNIKMLPLKQTCDIEFILKKENQQMQRFCFFTTRGCAILFHLGKLMDFY